jgi:hypothetical protein
MHEQSANVLFPCAKDGVAHKVLFTYYGLGLNCRPYATIFDSSFPNVHSPPQVVIADQFDSTKNCACLHAPVRIEARTVFF